MAFKKNPSERLKEEHLRALFFKKESLNNEFRKHLRLIVVFN